MRIAEGDALDIINARSSPSFSCFVGPHFFPGDKSMKITSDNGLSRRTFLRYSAAGAAALMTPVVLKAADDQAPIAKTTAGQIRGQVDGGAFVFKGVPYGMDTAKTRFA